MTHSHRRATSRNEYFRMDVPKDIRDLAGVTSWQHSLETSDPYIAKQRRLSYSSHYMAEVNRLRAIKAEQAHKRASVLVGRAFDRLEKHFGSLDMAVTSELQRVALIVRSSWSADHAIAVEEQHFGESDSNSWDPERVAIPSIDDEDGRRLFNIRAKLFEGKGRSDTDGIAYQDLAQALLDRSVYRPIEFVISYLPYLVPEIDLSTPAKYDAIAKAYLMRLATHRYTDRPEDIREALLPFVKPEIGRDEDDRQGPAVAAVKVLLDAVISMANS
jgi:hypothetical protein